MSIGCHWTLEQPSSSLLYRHRRFQEFCQKTFVARLCYVHTYMYPHRSLPECSASKVYRQFFWMGRLGAPTPKRSVLYSSSKAIFTFRQFARLSKKDREKCKAALAKSSLDPRTGKTRFSGVKKKLKASQCLSIHNVRLISLGSIRKARSHESKAISLRFCTSLFQSVAKLR